jgi:hypothetical protein
MESVLWGLTYEACLVSLDDVIVVGRTFQERLDNLRKVFQRFQRARLKLNPEKCQLLQKEVCFLGHIELLEGMTTDPEKLKAAAMAADKEQTRAKNLPSAVWSFIAGFADIAKPLSQLTEQMGTYQWSPEADATFRALKEALCTAPVLGYLRLGKKFIVETDASYVAIVGVL